MTLPSVLVVGSILLPVFFGTWSVSLLALSIQAACGVWLGLLHGFDATQAQTWLTLLDACLRVLLGPLLLWSVARQKPRPPFELIPVNIGHWLAVGAILFAALTFGRQARALDPDAPAAALAATAACVMFAFLVLSVQPRIASQAVAILILENGGFVLEHALGEQVPVLVQLALTAVYVGTLVCLRHALEVSTSAELQA